jgi:pilus assembly protein Flp/PilA
MRRLYVQLRCFGFAREGTTAIEYSVIATGIAVALIAVINQLGTSVKALWTAVASALG